MRKTGFTLLELLIVIIIIGVLAAIAMTQYSGAIANAKNSYAKSVLQEMRKAAIAYESLNKTWPSVFPITANLDGITGDEVTFYAPTSADYAFTITGSGSTTAGVATVTGGGTGALKWRLYFATDILDNG